MRHLGAVLAIAGLTLAAILFARENVGEIVDLVIAAGPGLVLAALFHVVPMVANALAWQRLLSPPQRPGVRVLTWATWLRESVNGLLPVARIGGEIVAYRIVRRHVAHRSEAAASLVADMALSVLSQAGFALLGLALLFAIGHASAVTAQLVVGIVAMIPLGAGFVLAQQAGVLGAVTRILDRLFAGRLRLVHTQSLRFDSALRAMYVRRGDVAACFAWQLAGWVLGAGEIWLALHFLGHQRSLVDAVVIEALIQAISSAAFFVPGALGVQEGGFVLICAALGIDAATALALATARRLRDVIIFFPGLIAWQWAETRIRSVRSTSASPLR
jgi:glycosyltransferase 2 family protein